MNFEVINATPTPGRFDFPGVVSIIGPKWISDILFQERWNVSMIRPLVHVRNDKNSVDQRDGERGRNTYDQSYLHEISTQLDHVQARFNNVVLIDFRIQSRIPADVILNFKDHITDDAISPVITNIRLSGWSCELNRADEYGLLQAASRPAEARHGFQVILRESLFQVANSELSGSKLFEEILIFTGLSLRGRI